MNQPRTVAVVCMPEPGHFGALRGVIATTVAMRMSVHVLTHRDYRPEVERLGARFLDVFRGLALEEADDRSSPFPCRYVTFAGCYADMLAADLRAIGASLVIYETFSVVAVVAARQLGIPYVNVCAGHRVVPRVFLERLQHDPRVAVSDACLRAVDRLRTEYRYEATPFSYISALSPYLNLYCEPPEFLDPSDRAVFEPIAFFGSICASDRQREAKADLTADFSTCDHTALKIYASFGTIVWRYYERDALMVLRALADCASAMENVKVIISLGSQDVDTGPLRVLNRPNVRAVGYVDQWHVLGQADLFLTHHGINSTHESIFQQTPMLSYPFFTDQPELARKCQALGLAIPVCEGVRGTVDARDFSAAIGQVLARREKMHARLAAARQWELATIQSRPEVFERILALR